MKGKVAFDKKSKRYYVAWYDESTKKTVKLWFYHGASDIPFRKGKQGKELAQRMLDQMRGDYESDVFRMEKYTLRASDVVPYLRSWLEAIKSTLTPATYHDYANSIENHLAPFFNTRGIQLHDVRYDVLMQLLSSIQREGKGKMNVMYCLHACLDHAWRAGRIAVVPPFPKKHAYQIQERAIRWLPEQRQRAIIGAIPLEDQPIFWWLKYHLRRPAEAMALLKEDFDGTVFTVQRSFSARQHIDRTKTGEVHTVPAVGDWLPYEEIEKEKQRSHGIISPYYFVYTAGRREGKHYTHTALSDMWHAACATVGEDIDLYSGLKHSSCSQLVNEYGYSVHEVQMATDHARLESVRKYAKVEVSARKAILEKKVVHLPSHEIARDATRKDTEIKG